MILLTHIIIAISSVIYTSLLLLRPTQAKLSASYILVGATLASGIYLTAVNPASMLRTCTTGLVYVVIVTAGIALARRKLAVADSHTAEKIASTN
jgi:hypothetical protein